MKTILVPTDFSETAENAARYAMQAARAINAKLVLMHVYHIPATMPEVPLAVPVSQFETTAMETLKKSVARLQSMEGQPVHIDPVCRMGFAAEEIEQFCAENPVDFVVMGMRGAGFVGERIIGSITTSVIAQQQVPVIAVNANAVFSGISRMVLAYDYKTIEKKAPVETVKAFAGVFKSHVFVLKVCAPGQMDKIPDTPEAVAGVQLDHLLEGIDRSFHFIEDTEVAGGINRFAAEKKADMVVMMPHRHSFFKRLFQNSETRHMAFHLDMPLLVIPG